MPAQQKIHYLADYQQPDYVVETTDLVFDIWPQYTEVTSKMHIRSHVMNGEKKPLILDGEQLELLELHLNDKKLTASDYQLTDHALIIEKVPEQFYISVKTKIYPEKNKALNGLFNSKNIYCTQCEPHGFRRMTYYIDRPDVMAIFTTKIIADKKTCPVLLSNGNLIESGNLNKQRHFAKWHDPFKKPSYLFALVAGDLSCNSAQYITCSGKEVDLHIYTEHENKNKSDYALQSLQRAMRWDEAAFGLEYDLQTYMIVAVNDFNMGAMENKGLNIFNAKYILANPAIATDIDYQNIEAVVGHEYFHNWTGNRVTLRDWFQLSLKEGLTVFRDQEFSAYHWSAAVKRIEEVKVIYNQQFQEDEGPLSHPVQPQSYIQMNNFYTLTVYRKGAEVIRMLYYLLGANGFRLGMDLYFSRFDGCAVTTDDFLQAMSDANHYPLQQFKRWYTQAGTPTLEIKWEYHSDLKALELEVSQSYHTKDEKIIKLPVHLPLIIGLLDENGKEMRVHLKSGERSPNQDATVLNISEPTQKFYFDHLRSKPIPSLLRHFSAPVRLKAHYTKKELLILMEHDTDPFARWRAAQELFIQEIRGLLAQYLSKKTINIKMDEIIEAFTKILHKHNEDPAFVALLLQLPDENNVIETHEIIDVDAIYSIYRELHLYLAQTLQHILLIVYRRCHSSTAYHINPVFAAQRSLKNICLRYLGRLNTDKTQALIKEQYYHADNMTDRFAALQAINHVDCPLRHELLTDFALAWKHEPLVLDKWFALQAMSELSNVTDDVEQLLQHPDFLLENPNKLYALLGTFSQHNLYNFHEISGKGYKLLADEILRVDKFNPQVAARLASAFSSWRRFDKNRQKLMENELKRIVNTSGLSSDVYEIVSKSLA